MQAATLPTAEMMGAISSSESWDHIIIIIIIIIIIYVLNCLLTAVGLSLGGSSPCNSYRQKHIRINIHKRNNTKSQYIRYNTQ